MSQEEKKLAEAKKFVKELLIEEINKGNEYISYSYQTSHCAAFETLSKHGINMPTVEVDGEKFIFSYSFYDSRNNHCEGGVSVSRNKITYDLL